MQTSSTRGVDPSRAEISVQLDEADLEAAFADKADQGLFFALNQPRGSWEKLPVSEQLGVFAKVAKLAEDEFARRAEEKAKAEG